MNVKTRHKPLTPWPASKCDQVGTLMKTIPRQIFGSHQKKKGRRAGAMRVGPQHRVTATGFMTRCLCIIAVLIAFSHLLSKPEDFYPDGVTPS